MTRKVALIDGDIIVYSCGFASDAAAKANGMTREPLGHCLNGVNETIKAIMRATDCNEARVWLTSSGGEGGYRDDLYPDYKANRTAAKPQWYGEIRSHLLGYWCAEESTDGREADDELGIDLVELGELGEYAVLCSKDKDLDMIPGLHYNFSKTKKDKGVYMVSKVEGDRFFYKQMLTGDSTDNIPGMYKSVGVKATAKWLQPIDEMKEPEEMFSYVREVYMTLGKEAAEKGASSTLAGRNLATTEGCEAFLLLIGTLLWIQRKEGGLWIPPTGGLREHLMSHGGKDASHEAEKKPKKTIKPKAS